MVDLECRTLEEEQETPLLREFLEPLGNEQIIASFHDFQSVPDLPTVERCIATAEKFNAILKIACTVNSLEEQIDWTRILKRLRETARPFSFMGMGQFGMATRLTAASAGSALNFGYLQKASVPGQWPARLLKQAIACLPEKDDLR